jgi:hypothetical protein
LTSLYTVQKAAEDVSVLRRKFGPNKEEVTGGWRKLHNEYILYSSPDMRVIKSRERDARCIQYTRVMKTTHNLG